MGGIRHPYPNLAGFLLLVLFAGLVAGGLAYFVSHSRQQAVDSHLDLTAMYSRMFEYQLTRTLARTEQTLSALLGSIRGDDTPVRVAALLQQALRDAPHLRSLSVMDGDGTIVHSSNPRNIGHRPAPEGLEPPYPLGSGALLIGTPWTGRDLTDGRPLLPDGELPESVPRGFVVVSMLSDIGLEETGQERWMLLAALNIDHFVSEFTRYLDPGSGIVRILRDDRRLLATTRVDELPALGQLHPVALLEDRDFLAQPEYQDITTYQNREVLSAYRVSSLFPVLLVTDLDFRTVMTDWRVRTRQVVSLIGALGLAIILLMCWLFVEQRRRVQLRALAEQQEREHLTAVMNHLPASIVMLDNEGRAVISDRKASEAHIRHLSEHDFLTGLPNRILFQDRLTQLIVQGRRDQSRFAVLFIDLDRFKRVNDTYGHHGGDALLRQVSERLGACVRSSDTVSRQGGDEFLLLLPDIRRSDDPGRVAAKIIQLFKQPFRIDDTKVMISPSIGIALFPDDGRDMETLIRNADMAMYFSKEQGRNTYHYFRPGMDVDVQKRLEMENGLRRAILNDELALYYQPQLAMDNRRLLGVEALVRWNHPERGRLSPDRFIPIAEETGLIVTLGDWVLRRACRQIRSWRDAGLSTVPVAINVAATQFANPGFVDSVRQNLEEYGLAADAIELEVTESSLLQAVSGTGSLIPFERLKSLGIQLAIDDFGTGYSSLSYLRQLPVDKLKIDRSFIRDICDDPENALITEAIVRMAHGIGLSVMAEGVETVEQLDKLRALGCDSFQGYLHSPPVSAEVIARRLKSTDAAD